MASVKVLPKYQITIPKAIRKKMNLRLGDALVIEEVEEKIILKKGTTLYDHIGSLPNLGFNLETIREKAIQEAMKDE